MIDIQRKSVAVLVLIISMACVVALQLGGQELYRIERRDSSVGIEEQIILREHPRLALRLYNRSTYRLDVLLDGHAIQRNINIGAIDREQLSVSRLLEMSGRKVDWARLLPAAAMKQEGKGLGSTEQLIAQLRPLLPTLPDAEDGATDEQGRLVKIETGTIINEGGGFNCSGFSKWVIDGLLFPISKRYLSISQLKQRQLQQRGHSISARYEQERDPYFGLDWSRALAAAYYRAQHNVDHETAVRAVSVRSVPYFSYVDDIGYAVSDLQAVLYLLALQEPHNFYVGSLNKDFGSSPRLRQHFHIALLFPYFTADGEFKVAVLERNRETDFAEFIARNRDIDIHLVRASSSTHFAPPRISL